MAGVWKAQFGGVYSTKEILWAHLGANQFGSLFLPPGLPVLNAYILK